METTHFTYDELIDNRIERCLNKAMALAAHPKSGCIRRCAEKVLQEASYYTAYRDRLAEQMAIQHVATSQHTVDRFLEEAFSERPFAH